MNQINLGAAQTVISAALAHGRAKGFMPLAVAVLDPRGA